MLSEQPGFFVVKYHIVGILYFSIDGYFQKMSVPECACTLGSFISVWTGFANNTTVH